MSNPSVHSVDANIPPPPHPVMRSSSFHSPSNLQYNPLPQNAPGASAAVGHTLENSIPLSIFPVSPDRFCIALCGLPGRGKTQIARRLGRYLEFFHAVPVQLYHIADYRRKVCGQMIGAEWFEKNNADSGNLRKECIQTALRDMTKFLNENSDGVAIYDSINETHEMRLEVAKAARSVGAKIMWIEVTNDDQDFLREQYEDHAKTSPDYVGVDNAQAHQDYQKRVDIFRAIFETIDGKNEESHWSYMKCDHSKQHFVIHDVKGYLFQKVVTFLMNMRTTSHAFYLTRHGQSEYNDLGKIGGDSGLTQHGMNYAKRLAEFVEKKIVKDEDGNDRPARLWTSTMRRTKETAQFIKQNKIIVQSRMDPSLEYEWVQMRPRAWHHLDELFAGACDGMTYEEIEAQFPDEWELRSIDKLAYRYPRGESYLDVIARLEPIIIEMERHQEPLLIIAHQGILRIIYAFYMGLSRADAPYVSIPLNTVVELVPKAYTCKETRYLLYSPKKALKNDGQTEKDEDDPQSH